MSTSPEMVEASRNDLASPAEATACHKTVKDQTTTLDTIMGSSRMQSQQTSSKLVEIENDNLLLPDIDPRGLRFAPPEIREMIFMYYFGPRFYLHFDMPNLFEALKGDKYLYKEARMALSKFCTFCICWDDEGKGKLPPYTWIHKLEIRAK